MKPMRPPSYEPRGFAQLKAELRARAAAWLPNWSLQQTQADFGQALLAIVARLESEVTQRLDKVPDKAFRGFLDWVGVRGEAGHAARMPVAFGVTPGSQRIDALAPIRMEAAGPDGSPVVFEIDTDMRILPARLTSLVAADPTSDRFHSTPARVLSLDAPSALPTRWQVTLPSQTLPSQLQLDPPIGLATGDLLADPDSGLQYSVTTANGGIVTIAPPLGTAIGENATPTAPPTQLVRMDRFDAFGAGVRNQQAHELYIGATKALAIETAVVIEIVCASALPASLTVGATWEYWGFATPNAPPDWLPLVARADSGRLFIVKPAGAMVATKVGGVESLWLRASVPPASSAHPLDGPSTVSGLKLKIDCAPSVPPTRWPATIQALRAATASPPVAIEAIANTAPIVLGPPFYPLGMEPRLFDAFYLGCAEAFSKASASVVLNVRLGDGFASPLKAFDFDTAQLIVGLGADGMLRREKASVDEKTRLQIVALQSTQPLRGRVPVALDIDAMPGTAFDTTNTAHVTVAASPEIWRWSATGVDEIGQWVSLLQPASGGLPGDSVLVRAADLKLRVYAIFGTQVHWRDALTDDNWTQLSIHDGNVEVEVARIVPVHRLAFLPGARDEAGDIACVSRTGDLFVPRQDGSGHRKVGIDATQQLEPDRYPLVLRDDGKTGKLWIVAVVRATSKAAGDVMAMTLEGDVDGPPSFFKTGQVVSRTFLPVKGAGNISDISVVFSIEDSNERGRPCSLAPFASPEVDVPAEIALPNEASGADEAPVQFGKKVIFAQADGTLWATSFDEFRLGEETVTGFKDTFDGSKANYVALEFNDKGDKGAVIEVHPVHQHDSLWTVVLPMPLLLASGLKSVRVFQSTSYGNAPNHGAIKDANSITLDVLDTATIPGSELLVTAAGRSRLVKVKNVVKANGVSTAELETRSRLGKAKDVSYLTGTAEDLQMAPFPHGQSFTDVRFDNPAISWEYFNGSGWWQVKALEDGTHNLTRSADITFCAPSDWQKTDVVGRKNYWLRARLVGGDYGRESVRLLISPDKDENGNTVQTVTRDSDNIHAPLIADISVAYQLCCPVVPDYVFTSDGGETRNQSDANRAANASIEFFVPLSVETARLSNMPVPVAQRPAASAEAQDNGCCRDQPVVATPQTGAADADARGRCIYLGFDSEISGEFAIQLLFMVEGDPDDSAFPLRLESLSGGRFQPVVATDGTRGLSESGVVSFTLPESPQQATLFGQPRFWLRLSPAEKVSSTWSPRILGAYLNAAFAVGAQTQRLESLGSSDGSPSQHFTLAKRPILADSLELRVREPLADEDARALLASNDLAVVPRLGQWDGPWVLWTEVIDPADANADARVYSLDDDTGDISFGDGIHGRIPPIGTNAIVAAVYQCGGGAAANGIAAWTPLNLVTPLQGVQRVVAVDAAAGGSDAQDAATAIRFAPANLRLRGRALGLEDLEILAMQSAPVIGQVRALATAAGVRIVVVARGPDPVPSVATLRELKRSLLACTGPSLAAPGALEVDAPTPVRTRIDLTLSIATLDVAGKVASAVDKQVRALFDATSGDLDHGGWRLGRLPEDTDAAACLADVEGLEGIDAIQYRIVAADGTLAALPRSLRPDQLLTLAPNGVFIQFASSGTEAAP